MIWKVNEMIVAAFSRLEGATKKNKSLGINLLVDIDRKVGAFYILEGYNVIAPEKGRNARVK